MAYLSLAIVLFCIILFITRPIPNAVTACLGCLLFAVTGICSIDKAFSGFSNSTVLLMFGMMVVGIAMMDTGAAQLIGKYVTKVSAGNEKLFIFLAGTSSAVLSTFLSNTAVIAIFLPIIESVSRANRHMNRMSLTLPVTMGAMFGGVCTLVGSTPQLTANGILQEMNGVELKIFDLMLPGLILFAIYMVYSLTIGHKLGNCIWGKREAESTSLAAPETQDVSVSKIKLVFIMLIFTTTVVLFIGAWIPPATTAIIAALLCVVTKCTNQKSIIKNMDWSVVFILAGCLGIAAGLNSGGVGELISSALSKVLSPDITPFILFAIFVFVTMLISNFITNSTAVVITLPPILALCSTLNLNPITYTLGIIYAANLTFSTPLANAQTAMTMVAGYKFSDYIKYTLLLDILVYIGILVTVPIFFPLV